ncbi:carboxylesterase/lipase family protein [soil metagenome]
MNFGDVSRRSALAGGLMLLPAGAAFAQDGKVVETTEGRYRGRVVDGVHVFKGMRYGASTAGPNRFMPPRPAETFAGVRDAFDYGDQAPQAKGGLSWNGPMSEDCLRVNVWTPAPGDGGKRPVLLWFHGGGFEAGHGSSLLYDGNHLVKRGDVVTCTINHRLNVFGFCDLSGMAGPEFKQSGNVGYLDLVAAMKWVRANISAFGGDPNNVMIYGQSGGGRKVAISFAGKDAQGLFAKGVIQSGPHLMILTQDQSAAITTKLLKTLDIDPKNARELQRVPMDKLGEAQRGVIAGTGYRFEPVLDHVTFDAHPFVPNAPRMSAKVPMMIGTCKTELSNQLGRDPAIYTIDDAQLRQRLKGYIPDKDMDACLKVFKASSPKANPTELFFKITSWRSYILNSTVLAEKRDILNGAHNPTWMYQVTWRSPAEGGRRISQHTLDLPFMFDNVDKAANLTGPETEETRAMAQAMSESWLSFARTSNPNHKGIAHWPTYDRAKRQVMLFDTPAKVVADPFKSERVFIERYPYTRTTHKDD